MPDIHNKGINGKEKCKDSNEFKKKTNKKHLTWRESGHLFFVLHVFFFSFYYKMVFDHNVLLMFFNPNLGIYGGFVSNFVRQLQMAVVYG